MLWAAYYFYIKLKEKIFSQVQFNIARKLLDSTSENELKLFSINQMQSQVRHQ